MMEDEKYGKEFLGTGLGFPVMVDPATGRFRTSSYEDDIKEAIYIILMTKKGERLMRPEFGCGIHDFAFATLDYTTISQMEKSVKEALIQWEPRIRDISVEVSQSMTETGKAIISISYVVRSTNNPYNLVFPFFMNEGIEL